MATLAQRRTHTPPWGWAVLGAVLGLLLTLCLSAPAYWLAWGLAKASHNQVVLTSPRGSVWSGSAQLTLRGGDGSRDLQVLPGRIQWQIQPGWLSLKVGLKADCCMDGGETLWHVKAGLSTVSLRVEDHRSHWPAGLLKGLGAPWNTLQAEGQLHVRTEQWQLHWAAGRLQMRGLLALEAHNMTSRLSTLKPMGSYRLELRGSPEGSATPDLQLSTLQGPLLLSGKGQWVGARLRFSGEASADLGSEAALSNLLNIIGRRQGARSLLSIG